MLIKNQSVINNDSVVASHIIAIVSCIGMMVTHVVSSISVIMKDDEENIVKLEKKEEK